MSSSLLEELLPGIADDVTLNLIAPKLPWVACQTLSTMSLGWQQAVESHEVSDSRAFYHSRETLVVVKHQDSNGTTELSLYSMREKAFNKLPPIPHLEGGIPPLAQLVSLDGKLYVLGDTKQSPTGGMIDRQDIHMLDLAWQRQWKQCGSVPIAIPAEISGPFYHNFTMGCGVILGDDLHRGRYMSGGNANLFKSGWHVHDPANNVFRPVSPLLFLTLDSSPGKLVWKGKFYFVGAGGIFVVNAGVWTMQHSKISCHELGSMDSVTIQPLLVLPVCNELLAIVRWKNKNESPDGSHSGYQYCLLQSRGFGTPSIDIVWEKGPDCFHFDEFHALAMCPIQL